MQNKRLSISLAVFCIAIVFFIVTRFFSGPEDAWICQNGQWVKHGNPFAAMPTTPCPGQQQPPLTEPDVVLSTLKSNDIITSPLIVEGKAKGYFFEGSFPVELVDANGNVLVQTTADATENWMQIGYVKFQSRISFDS